jgi:2-polyprenyl-6-methoxyphenol hydroxylase-like FAD-dependent oxidoreductase
MSPFMVKSAFSENDNREETHSAPASTRSAMLVKGSNVAVIGGSIAGCAAAVALSRAGCSVTVYERQHGGLRGQGAGIPVAWSARDDLVAAGYLNPGMRARFRDDLTWLTRDGESLAGCVLGRQPFPTMIANWELLWQDLHERLPAGSYHGGVEVGAIRPDPGGVTLEVAGRAERFDIVVGADGRDSRVRGLVAPEARPVPTAYGLWRGDFPAERLSGIARSRFTEEIVAVGFPGGHGLFYLVPEALPGRLRQNWAIYGPVPEWAYLGDPAPIPRGLVGEDAVEFLRGVVDDQFPSVWAEVIRRTEPGETSLTPVQDLNLLAYASGPLLLIGDAGTLVRPHIGPGAGTGAVKALLDAYVLERACRENATWEAATTAYDAERSTAGNAFTEFGRHLGRLQVEAAPDWTSLVPERFAAWLRSATEGWRTAYGRR